MMTAVLTEEPALTRAQIAAAVSDMANDQLDDRVLYLEGRRE
jgi:hypothetical protein